MGTLPQGLADFEEFNDKLDLDGFSKILDTFLSKGKEGRAVLVLNEAASWTTEWIKLALDKLGAKTSKVEFVCHLALWDFGLAEELISAGITALSDPSGFLRRYGEVRRWDGNGTHFDLLWMLGCADIFEGDIQYHSAYLVLANRLDIVETRIWKAQLRTFFPILEEKRQKMVRKYYLVLETPDIFDDRNINSREDYSFSHLLYQLRGRGDRWQLTSSQSTELHLYMNMRNSLAHGTAVDWEVLSRFIDLQEPES